MAGKSTDTRSFGTALGNYMQLWAARNPASSLSDREIERERVTSVVLNAAYPNHIGNFGRARYTAEAAKAMQNYANKYAIASSDPKEAAYIQSQLANGTPPSQVDMLPTKQATSPGPYNSVSPSLSGISSLSSLVNQTAKAPTQPAANAGVNPRLQLLSLLLGGSPPPTSYPAMTPNTTFANQGYSAYNSLLGSL